MGIGRGGISSPAVKCADGRHDFPDKNIENPPILEKVGNFRKMEEKFLRELLFSAFCADGRHVYYIFPGKFGKCRKRVGDRTFVCYFKIREGKTNIPKGIRIQEVL